MLFVFCGNRFLAREAGKQCVSVCQKKRPGAEYIYLAQNIQNHSLEELFFGQGLFEKKYIVFCDEIIGTQNVKHMLSNVKSYVSSSHMFIVFEPKLSKSEEKKFSGATIKRFSNEDVLKDSKQLFSFLDVYVRGNKTKTFVAFHRLINNGEAADSIINILVWQLKTLILVQNSSSITVAGVKPFVYTKSKKALNEINNPFGVLMKTESIIRNGRLNGLTNEEIMEYIILSS